MTESFCGERGKRPVSLLLQPVYSCRYSRLVSEVQARIRAALSFVPGGCDLVRKSLVFSSVSPQMAVLAGLQPRQTHGLCPL
jgi:hypothetical protein